MTETAAQQAKAPTAYTPGAFVWHELYTTDIQKSMSFYKELLGWRIEKSPMPEMDYYLVYVGQNQIAGMFQPPQGLNYWQGYLSVADVDAHTKKAEAAGAKIMMPPTDIPHVGRFSAVLDPQGAIFSFFKSAHGDPDGEAMPEIGEFCWDSLNTPDMDASIAFYEKAAPWRAEKNLGGAVFKAGELMEASANDAPGGQGGSWLAHIYVKDLAASTAKVEQLGGKLLMPGVDAGEWGKFSVVMDPVGSVFSLFQPNQG